MPKRILITDDGPDILDILSLVFQDEGYNVVTSDPLVLDVRIPTSHKNGDVVCAEIKSNTDTRKLPVLLISGEMNLKDICVACGVDDYLAKPYDLEDLSAKVHRLMDYEQ